MAVRPRRSGLWQALAGAVLLVSGLLLLLPGIDRYNAAAFGAGGGEVPTALPYLVAGTVLLVVGVVLTVVGEVRRRADLSRPRTYGSRGGHGIRAEDRPTNPYDTSLRGYQEGIH